MQRKVHILLAVKTEAIYHVVFVKRGFKSVPLFSINFHFGSVNTVSGHRDAALITIHKRAMKCDADILPFFPFLPVFTSFFYFSYLTFPLLALPRKARLQLPMEDKKVRPSFNKIRFL